jgi:hypothetical protein
MHLHGLWYESSIMVECLGVQEVMLQLHCPLAHQSLLLLQLLL